MRSLRGVQFGLQPSSLGLGARPGLCLATGPFLHCPERLAHRGLVLPHRRFLRSHHVKQGLELLSLLLQLVL